MKLKIATLALVTVATLAATLHAAPSAAPGPSPWALRFSPPALGGATPAASPAVNVVEAKPVAATPAQLELGAKMIAAINAHDSVKYKQLLAPANLACFNKDNQPYLDYWLGKQIGASIPASHRIGAIELPRGLSDHTRYADYPVHATHMISIECPSGGGGSITYNRMIAQQQGKWYAVAPCPTAEGLARVKSQQKMKAARKTRAEELYPQLKDPLKLK